SAVMAAAAAMTGARDDSDVSPRPGCDDKVVPVPAGGAFYRARQRRLSRILSQEDLEALWAHLPGPYRLMDPVYVYTTVDHGCALRQLYTHASRDVAP